MDILYLLIPLSIVLVFAIGGVFWWALESGQFEDLDGPAHAVLDDDDRVVATNDPRAGPGSDSPAPLKAGAAGE